MFRFAMAPFAAELEVGSAGCATGWSRMLWGCVCMTHHRALAEVR
jgi:hypothetical protein